VVYFVLFYVLICWFLLPEFVSSLFCLVPNGENVVFGRYPALGLTRGPKKNAGEKRAEGMLNLQL